MHAYMHAYIYEDENIDDNKDDVCDSGRCDCGCCSKFLKNCLDARNGGETLKS